MLKKWKKEKRLNRKFHSKKKMVVTGSLTAAATVGAVLMTGSMHAHAEGSKEMVQNGGDRPFTQWDSNTMAGIDLHTTLKVYVKPGETINLGSSVYNATNNQDIVLKDPTGVQTTFDVLQTGQGFINTLAKEKAGPLPNTGGYTPFQITATTATQGWWTVEFHGPSNGNTAPTPTSATANFPTDNTQGRGAAAWDITVVDQQGSPKLGRVYTNYVALYMGANSRYIKSKFYILTTDGYQYLTDLNGIDPNRFIFFSNNRGFVNADNSTLYHDVNSGDDFLTTITGGAKVLNPSSPNTATDITHKVFFNPPSPDLPPDVPTSAIAPEIPTNFKFTNKSQTGNQTAVGAGGDFEFNTSRSGSYRLIVDVSGPSGKPDGKFNTADDVVLENVSVAGKNIVHWDGKDKNGNNVPAGLYDAKLMMKGGEYHFPMLDVEQAPNGVKIQLQNAPGAFASGLTKDTVYYNDDNYKTSNGTSVSLDPKTGEVAPSPRNATMGVDSSIGAHAFDSNYGNWKGVDTWTYFLGTEVLSNVVVTDATVSGNVFNDINFSGKKEAGEAGLSNIKVTITDSTGNPQTVTTDASGNYSADVMSGQVSVTVDSSTIPAGYMLTTGNPAQILTVAAKANGVVGDIGYALNHDPMGTDLDLIMNHNTTLNGRVNATDQDNDPLSYTLNTGAAHGTVTVNLDGTWVYRPEKDYLGDDAFTVLVDDGRGGKDVVTVAIHVKNLDPVVGDDTVPTDQNNPVSGKVTATDLSGSGTLTYTVDTNPSNGAVTVNPDGTWTYTPAPGFAGDDSFKILVEDGNGGQSVATITVHVNNITPTVSDYTENTDQVKAVSGAVVGTDAGLDKLTYSLDTGAANGVVTVNPDGTWTYTPNAGFAGDDSFKVLVDDGHGGTTVATVTVHVNNIVPTVGNYVDNTDQVKAVSGAVVATDAGQDTLTYSLQSGAANGTVVVNPDGTWTYTPNPGFAGDDSFKVLVDDGHGGTTVATVTVHVNNIVPTVGNYVDNTDQVKAVSGAVVGNDAGQDTLTYSLQSGAANGIVVVNPDGTWTYTPNAGFAGDDSFKVLVDDGHGGTTVATVTVHVNNIVPTVGNYVDNTDQVKAVSGAVVGTDAGLDKLTYSLDTGAANGVVSVNPDGTWTYTPNAGFAGDDSFKVLVDDGHGGTTVATVTVHVNNIAPTVGNFVDNTDQVKAVSGAVVGTDAGQDTLTYSLQSGAANGVVTVNPDGTWTYTPNAGFAGDDSFKVLVDDGHGGTTVATVTVHVNNIAPTVGNYVDNTGQVKAVSGAVVATDAGQDTLTYSLQSGAANGTVVVNPDGTWTYTPNAGFAGDDSFKVLVDDGHGGTTVATVTVHVNNIAPTVGNYVDNTDQVKAVSGAVVAADGGLDTLTYSLQSGAANGTVVVNPDGTWTYTPNAGFAGDDSFKVLVDDGHGGTTVATVTVHVNNIAPTVGNYVDNTDQFKAVSGTVVGTDAGQDTLTYSLQSGAANGTVVVNPDGTWTYTPNPGFAGDDSFKVLVDDGHGGTTVATVTVHVNNIAPTVSNYDENTDQVKTISGAVAGNDAGQDTLTYSLQSGAANGSVIVNPDGTWTYTPNAGFAGDDSFKVLIDDGHGGTTIATVTVHVKNIAPTANNDEVTTEQRKTINGKIAASDAGLDPLTYSLQTGPTNGTVTVNLDGTWSYTPNNGYAGDDSFKVLIEDGHGGQVTATITVHIRNIAPTVSNYNATTEQKVSVSGKVIGDDLGLDPLTYSLKSGTSSGTVTVNPDGTWVYTPNNGFAGNDSFEVLVSDNHGGTTVATIFINVKNIAPTAGYYEATTNQNQPVGGKVSGSDPGLDPLSYTLESNAVYGTVIVSPDGTWTYIPNPGFTGNDSFTVLVTDGNGGQASSSVIIHVVNRAPVVGNYDATTTQNTTVDGKVTGTDPDQNTLTYSVGTVPGHGKVTVNPDGTWSYLPNVGFVGDDQFTVIVDDGKGGTAASTITIHVNNRVPIAENTETATTENTTVSGKINATDADQDTLIFTISTPPEHGKVTLNPDGTWTYTPDDHYVGSDSFTVQVSDQKGGTTTATVTINVKNQPPKVQDAQGTTTVDTALSGKIIAEDSDSLTYTKATNPAHGNVTIFSNGSWIYTPNKGYVGTDEFKVLVSDGKGGETYVTVRVKVKASGVSKSTGSIEELPKTGSFWDQDMLLELAALSAASGVLLHAFRRRRKEEEN